MFDKQMAMMPATQPYLHIAKEHKRKLAVIQDELDKLEAERTTTAFNYAAKKRNLSEIDRDLLDKRSALAALKREKNQVVLNDENEKDKKKEKEKEKGMGVELYVRPCPKDQCKGFLNQKWICGTCDARVCKHCAAETDGNTGQSQSVHVCNPNDVETMKLISKECKPCPTCKASTFKVDGCSQVWCVSCKTAFDWKTGKVDTGRIHAPDYYQWLRNNNHQEILRQNAAAVAVAEQPMCGRRVHAMVNISAVAGVSKGDHGPSSVIALKDRLYDFEIFVGHMERMAQDRRDKQQQLAKTRGIVIQNDQEFGQHLKLRVKYMLNDIDLKTFKAKLYADEKLRRYNGLYNGLVETLSTVSNSIMHRISIAKDMTSIMSLVSETDCIQTFFIEQLTNIARMYGYKLESLDTRWDPHGLLKK